MADERTPEQIEAAEALRVEQVAERETEIARRRQADVDKHDADHDRLLEQYEVHRRDFAENDPYSVHYGGCNLLVLDLDHDPFARVAAEAYAKAAAKSHPKFAAKLRAQIDGDV